MGYFYNSSILFRFSAEMYSGILKFIRYFKILKRFTSYYHDCINIKANYKQ